MLFYEYPRDFFIFQLISSTPMPVQLCIITLHLSEFTVLRKQPDLIITALNRLEIRFCGPAAV